MLVLRPGGGDSASVAVMRPMLRPDGWPFGACHVGACHGQASSPSSRGTLHRHLDDHRRDLTAGLLGVRTRLVKRAQQDGLRFSGLAHQGLRNGKPIRDRPGTLGPMDDLGIRTSNYPNISELYREGPWAFVAVRDGRTFRVQIRQSLAEGGSFWAYYEEQIPLKTARLSGVEVWVHATFPWQDGTTAEACLKGALRWVNQGGPEFPPAEWAHEGLDMGGQAA